MIQFVHVATLYAFIHIPLLLCLTTCVCLSLHLSLSISCLFVSFSVSVHRCPSTALSTSTWQRVTASLWPLPTVPPPHHPLQLTTTRPPLSSTCDSLFHHFCYTLYLSNCFDYSISLSLSPRLSLFLSLCRNGVPPSDKTRVGNREVQTVVSASLLGKRGRGRPRLTEDEKQRRKELRDMGLMKRSKRRTKEGQSPSAWPLRAAGVLHGAT